MSKRVLLFLADGFEEVEAVTPIDFIRRAGVELTTVGIGGKRIRGAHNIFIEADIELDDLTNAESYDGLIFPGGMPGAENIAAEKQIIKLINNYDKDSKIIAAICASPGVVLAETKALNGKRATCYPGFEKFFGSDTEFSNDRVVTDGHVITSRGPGTAAEFSIELIKNLADHDTAEQIKSGTIQKF